LKSREDLIKLLGLNVSNSRAQVSTFVAREIVDNPPEVDGHGPTDVAMGIITVNGTKSHVCVSRYNLKTKHCSEPKKVFLYILIWSSKWFYSKEGQEQGTCNVALIYSETLLRPSELTTVHMGWKV